MNPLQAYAAWSSTYDTDRNLTRDLDAMVTRRLFAGPHYPRILEPGCGTGKNTAFFAEHCDELLAFDLSPEMLARAREKVPLRRVTFVQADLTASWPCDDGYAALVSCNLVLEHLRSLEFIFSEAFRTLTPGGTLFVSELHPARQSLGTKATFTLGAQPVEIEAYVHHLSDFHQAATQSGFALRAQNEWWHDEDVQKPPRLVTLIFDKHR